jgi:hypothetical protein
VHGELKIVPDDWAGLAWVLAAALGLPASYAFVWLVSQLLLPMRFSFDPRPLLEMLVSLASVGPVWGASRVRIAETLRHE